MSPELVSRKQAKERGLLHYFTGSPCKYGHVSKRLVSTCQCSQCMRRYFKLPRNVDKEAKKEYDSNRYQNKKEEIIERASTYYLNNKELVISRVSEYTSNNREKSRGYKRRNKKNRLREDPYYRLLHNLRCRLNQAFRDQKYKKSGRTLTLTGCTILELVSHLTSLFQDGMTLGNYGLWQIDHIIPCFKWDLRCPIQRVLCFHYTNLQPLWVADHREKTILDRAS